MVVVVVITLLLLEEVAVVVVEGEGEPADLRPGTEHLGSSESRASCNPRDNLRGITAISVRGWGEN